MSSILDQIRSGAGKAAFEAEKLRKITAIRSDIRSLTNEVDEAFLRAGRVAAQLHQSNRITQPELMEVCAHIAALHGQIGAREREIEQIRSEAYEAPSSGPQYGHLCPNGHGELPPGARFCPKCGAEGIHVPPPAGASCPACGAALVPEARFCPSCGTPVPESSAEPAVEPTGTTCSTCGATLVPEARFCPECGTPVPESSTPAYAESQPQAVGEESTIVESSSLAELESQAGSPEEGSAPLETATEDPQVCPNCGAALVPGTIFCPDCGNRLDERAPVESAPDAQDESTIRWELGSAEAVDGDADDTWQW